MSEPRQKYREPVVLLDDSGAEIGIAEKLEIHHQDTPLHRAFSCYVFDQQGKVLVTQRALGKRVIPGVWTNSCCGHPAPGESFGAAIERRLRFELGMTVTDVQIVLPDYRYRTPLYNGIREHEVCPVFVAKSQQNPQPNPDEVGAWVWITWGEFVSRAMTDHDNEYSWWCKDQLQQLAQNPTVMRYAGLLF